MTGAPAVHAHAPAAIEQPPDPPAWRLVGTLGLGGALAGLLLVSVYQSTLPRIEANKAVRLQAAIEEVLRDPARYDTLYTVDGRLTRDAAASAAAGERVYAGYDDAGRRIGFAITAAQPGFSDAVRLIFGYDAATKRLLGMKVLEHRETPGLGDKIEKDSAFVTQFSGAGVPLLGVKPDNEANRDTEVDMITGATISSRTVIATINRAIERLDPLLAAYAAEAQP